MLAASLAAAVSPVTTMMDNDPFFFHESPCTVADLAPYLSTMAQDWCGVEHQAIQLKATNPSDAEIIRAKKLLAVRCALLLDDGLHPDIADDNRVMAQFAQYWKTVYCTHI